MSGTAARAVARRSLNNLREGVLATALTLHQLPDIIWHELAYEDLVDLGRINRKMNGEPAADDVEEADELDIEMMKELRLRASSAVATTSSSASDSTPSRSS